LCHHIKHTSFYLWSKYGSNWANIVSYVESFLTKLWDEAQFLNHILRHLITCFNHPNDKHHHHFNQELCEYLMKRQNLPNKLFCKCNGYSK